jgi:pimeloyl-ACP methyl ester carboxylesterase
VNPFFLGSAQRRLFGIHTSGVSRAGRSRAVVFCQPLGNEYVYAHRSVRQLANRLSLAGFHTLRFDYFGTGDSAGEDHECDAAGLQADVVTAIETLKDLAATETVTLIGLRAGANVAAVAAAGLRDAVESLVLWDPIGPLDTAALPKRSLLIVTQHPDITAPAGRSTMIATQDPKAPATNIEFLAAPCPWIESASTTGMIPVGVIQRIEEWLSQ